MPQLKISHTVSFSSEDPQHPASNLLASEISKKRWLCAKGETSLSVVLQLEKCSQITSVHIGSYHSALVEVLVGRSETPNHAFKVLVASSIFMTPAEARKNEAVSAVRTFSADQLQSDTKNERWDRIRVVCSQPYNKHCQFGLSFIHVFGPESNTNSDKPEGEKTQLTLGRFKLRPSSSDEDDSSSPSHFKPGQLFAKLKHGTGLSTDAQIRQSSSHNTLKNLSDKENPSFLVKADMTPKAGTHSDKRSRHTPASSSRNDVLYNDEDDEPNQKIDRLIEKDREEKAKKLKIEEETTPKRKESTSAKNDQRKKDIASIFSKNKKEESPKKKDKERSEKKKVQSSPREEAFSSKAENKRPIAVDDQASSSVVKKPRHIEETKRFTPYHSIMENVVFVFSGYINPQRSNLRDKAMAMGARYKQDWTTDSTHLICAFPNTPKLHQVRKSANSKVAIVTAEWIEECHTKEKLLPWEWFATEPKRRIKRDRSPSPVDRAGGESNGGDTDDEIEKVLKEQMQKYNENQRKKQEVKNESKSSDDSKESCKIVDDNLDDEMRDLPEDIPETAPIKERSPSSTPDIEMNSSGDTVSGHPNNNDESKTNGSFNLPDFFSDINFYIDPEVEDEGFSVDMLKRYIIAFNGNTMKDLKKNEDVNFILSFRKDDQFKSISESVRIVSPKWVWDCNDAKKKISFSKYLV